MRTAAVEQSKEKNRVKRTIKNRYYLFNLMYKILFFFVEICEKMVFLVDLVNFGGFLFLYIREIFTE